jgi:hypothetical protein
MNRLEEILKIADCKKRQEQLVNYARALNVNPTRARKPNGEWDEDVLTLLIYDAGQVKKTQKFQKVGLIVGAVFLTLMGVALISFLAKLFSQVSR